MSKLKSSGARSSAVAAAMASLVAGCVQGPVVEEPPLDAVAEASSEGADERPERPFRLLGAHEAPGGHSSDGPVALKEAPPAPLEAVLSSEPASKAIPAAARPVASAVSDAVAAVDQLVQQAEPAARPAASSRGDGRDERRRADTSALDAAYFNTPDFKREFARSFIRHSDVDPDLQPDEIEALEPILEDITGGKRDRALTRLRKEVAKNSTPTFNYLIGQLLFDSAREALDEASEEAAKIVADAEGGAPEVVEAAAQRAAEVEASAEERSNEIYDEAVTFYEAATQDYPNYLGAYHYLALVHFQRGRYREAAEGFSTELALGGVDKRTYGLLGVSLMNIERYLAAETSFRNALMLDPFNEQWSLGLSRCLFKQQRYGEMATLVGGMIEEQSDRAELWLLQGNAYVGMQQPELAAQNFRIAQKLGGATPDSLNLMADIYTNGGLADLAVDSYLEALAKSSTPSPDRALRSAKQMTRTGDLEQAARLLDGLESHFGADLADSKKDELLKLRSKLAVKLGNSEDEIATLKEIVDRNPLDGEALILLGEAYERAERFDEGAQTFETAAEIDGFGAEAKLKHGQMLTRQGQYVDAVALLKASLQLNDSVAVLEYLKGVEGAAKRAVR